MAESDRRRLLERALALPDAREDDFFGDRRPPDDADPSLLKRIDDTALRTKLIETRLAIGLQSPKGPQKIASILRIYPDFDAPERGAVAARSKNGRATTGPVPSPQRGLPTAAEMERLLARIREVEAGVVEELAAEIDDRVVRLKRSLGDLDGSDLETAYRELGEALDQKRALEAQVRFETFRRIERDSDFAERAYLRLLRH